MRTWQKKRSDGTEDDESLALVKAEVERIVSIFRSPLDAKAVMYVAVIQDEIQEAIQYHEYVSSHWHTNTS